MKTALVLGCGGQDGSFMCEVLLEQGYKVYGTTRRSSVDNLIRVSHIKDKITFIRADLTDIYSIHNAIKESKPDEIYNLADQDNIGWSRDLPSYSVDVTVKGVSNLLLVCKSISDGLMIFIPVSATIFGDSPSPQSELAKRNPLSPYACAKSAVYDLARYYRQIHGMYVTTGIMYNHHSPRRGKGYLLSDIQDKVLACERGQSDTIQVGSLEQRVDIGYAREYMEGVYKLMQLSYSTDVILSSGRGVAIAEIVQNFMYVYGVDVPVSINTNLKHDVSATELIGDCTKARDLIGWNPQYNASNICNIVSDR